MSQMRFIKETYSVIGKESRKITQIYKPKFYCWYGFINDKKLDTVNTLPNNQTYRVLPHEVAESEETILGNIK